MGIGIIISVVILIAFLVFKSIYSPLSKYNSFVDSIINEQYGIKTLDNSDFFSHSEYSSLLLNCLDNNINFDTAALKISCLYCKELFEKNSQEAGSLYKKILRIGSHSSGRGLINPDQAAEFIAPITIILNEYGVRSR